MPRAHLFSSVFTFIVKNCSFQSDWELPGSIDAAFTFQTKTYIFKVWIKLFKFSSEHCNQPISLLLIFKSFCSFCQKSKESISLGSMICDGLGLYIWPMATWGRVYSCAWGNVKECKGFDKYHVWCIMMHISYHCSIIRVKRCGHTTTWKERCWQKFIHKYPALFWADFRMDHIPSRTNGMILFQMDRQKWGQLKLTLQLLRITVFTSSRYKCHWLNQFVLNTPHSQGKLYFEWKNKVPRIEEKVSCTLKLCESYLAPRKSVSWWREPRAFLDPWQLPFGWATPSTFSRDPSTGRLRRGQRGAWQLLQTRNIPRKEGTPLLTSLDVARPRRKVL